MRETTIPARLRKLIGSAGVLAFLTGYVWLVVSLSERVPKVAAAQFAYFGLAGLLWGVPLLPAIKWMNRETPRQGDPRR